MTDPMQILPLNIKENLTQPIPCVNEIRDQPIQMIKYARSSPLGLFGWAIIRQFKMQKMEYAADAYAVRVTQDNGLIDFLDQIEHLDTTPNGVLAMHMRGHPPTALRRDEAEHILQSI